MDLRVDYEGGGVKRPGAVDDRPTIVHQEEVLNPDLLEIHTERIDPEMVEQLGVAGGDVPGGTFVKAEVPEDPERGGEPLLSKGAFLFHLLNSGKA